MSVYEPDMLNEMGEDVGVLEGAGGMERWSARFAPVNAGSDPRHDQPLPSTLCFSPGPWKRFCVRTVSKAVACGTVGILRLVWVLEVLPGSEYQGWKGPWALWSSSLVLYSWGGKALLRDE